MPVGGIGGSSKVDRGARGGRSAGAGSGGVAGHGSGAGISKGAGPLGGKSVASSSGGIGSANAAIGTFSQDRTALNNAYGGPVDDTGFLGKLLGYRTYSNPISNQSAGYGVNIGGLLGTLGGLAAGVPGLGMLGSQLGLNANFGSEFGSWRNGGGQNTGAPGLSGGSGRFGPMGYGMRGPAAQPGMSAAPASSGALPGTLSFNGAMQNPQGNFGLLNGYSANTRFGQGNLAAMPWGSK